MKNIWIILALVTTTMVAQNKNQKVAFEVNGKCEMCKMRIEKACMSVKGVKYALWDVTSHQLDLIIDENKTNAMAIKSAVANVGHDTKELKAPDDVYEKIHPCCMYREDNTDDSPKH